MNKNLLQVTVDGSHTILSETFDVTYHSKNGAITESNVVFIDAGLNYFKNDNTSNISIFEMGFGTGLNAFLSCLWAESNKILIQYHAVEAFPVSLKMIEELNYPDILGNSEIFKNIHSVPWEQNQKITPFFQINKENIKIEDYRAQSLFDIVFYDPFGPGTQPHLWEIPTLTKMYNLLVHNGLLVTYCAQGAFKRNIRDVGFYVENIPGPPGKREITRAFKK